MKAKSKQELVREYVAEHPEATYKEVMEAVGCSVKTVQVVFNPNTYERQKGRQRAYDRKRYREKVLYKTKEQAVKESKPKRKEQPDSTATKAMMREQNAIIERILRCHDSQTYKELARRYSELQMKIDYERTTNNRAKLDLIKDRHTAEKAITITI